VVATQGGNLAASLCIRLREQSIPLPATILSISAWYDPELKNETYEINAKIDKILSRTLMEFFRDSWLGSTGVAHNDPRVNLLYSDLAGPPPINIYYGAHELLVEEILEFADRKTVEERARKPVRFALIGPDGPTGTFSNAAGPLPW
jgi:acetyl esterase/lipase